MKGLFKIKFLKVYNLFQVSVNCESPYAMARHKTDLDLLALIKLCCSRPILKTLKYFICTQENFRFINTFEASKMWLLIYLLSKLENMWDRHLAYHFGFCLEHLYPSVSVLYAPGSGADPGYH